MNLENMLKLLDAHVAQRSGIDARNYISDWRDENGRKAFNADRRDIARAGADYRTMRRSFMQPGESELQSAFRHAYSGRLSLNESANRLEYCTGQYYPTEYRAAACAVLAKALWDTYRNSVTPSKDESIGNAIRAMFRKNFGRGIATRWFNFTRSCP